MAIAIPRSNTPMVFDALPAYKVRYFTGKPAAGKLYCYGKLYSMSGGIALGLYAFERKPNSESRIGFAIQADGDTLYLCAGPKKATLHRLTGGETTPRQAEAAELVATLSTDSASGVDEQGWFWSVGVNLSADFLQKAGWQATKGFKAGLYKYHRDEEAFGASTPFDTGKNPLAPAGMDSFNFY